MLQKTLTEDKIQEILRRIVQVAHPDRVILFGSAARGDMGDGSDVDLLVIKGGEYDHGRLVTEIYGNLIGVEQAVDVVLVTPEQVEEYRNVHWLVIAPALEEGREVYHAPEVSSP